MSFNPMEQIRAAFQHFYIWDSLEKQGFPISEDIYTVDMSHLTNEQRLIVASGDAQAIDELMKSEGVTLIERMAADALTFVTIIFKLYESESLEKRTHILELINSMRGDKENE